MVLIVMVVGVGLLGAGRSAACSCAGYDDVQAYDGADVVFVATVAGVERPFAPATSSDRAVWTFSVSQVFKGEAARTQGVVTSASGSSCGLELPESGEVVVFARHDAWPVDPQADWDTLHADLCGGSRVLDSVPVPASFGASRPPGEGSAGLPPLSVTLTSTRGAATVAAIAVALTAVAVVAVVLVVRRRRRRA